MSFSVLRKAKTALALAGLAAGLLSVVAVRAAEAADPPARISLSQGYVAAGDPQQGRGEPALVVLPGFSAEHEPRSDLQHGAPLSKQRNTRSESHSGTGYRIYDARLYPYYDDDGDGHFSALDVVFDADTDYFAADVYARLYLSLEGGPWQLYFTTGTFTLLGSSATDDYIVETELISGYPTGYYDVLIELYDEQRDELVASFGPYETSQLSAVPLEDRAKDNPVFEPAPNVRASVSSGGGGALGPGLLLVFGLAGWRRRARFLPDVQTAGPQKKQSAGSRRTRSAG